MRIASINMIHTGSTGKIMLGIAECACDCGHAAYTFSPNIYYVGKKMDAPLIQGHSYFGYTVENMLHLALSQATGIFECFSWFGTRQLIRRLKKIEPDIIHLHNLHNNSLDVRGLFRYIKKKQIKVVWTLHDCWAMTGKCPHFSVTKCNRWKTGCYSCPVLSEYPKTYVDNVKLMWQLKRKWFSGIENMTIVTPSKWLAGVVEQSFLSKYPIRVINSGIDLSIFKPTVSDVAQQYNIPSAKHIVLGVAFDWDNKKGLDVFVELAKRLPDAYQIVMVGTNETIDSILPDNIISVHRTQNQVELAQLYSIAKVFVNPTREEVLGLVNVEALACGTPVITFKSGGSPECIDESCGMIIENENIEMMIESIKAVCDNNLFDEKACVSRAEHFKMQDRYAEYIQLYRQVYDS